MNTSGSFAWGVIPGKLLVFSSIFYPPERRWRIWNPKVDGSCFSLNFQLLVGTSQAAFNAFNDLALAVFLAYILWHVQLAFKMKVAIISVMGAGILYLTLLIARRRRWAN
ncbi:hypothetical protein N7449_003730 [Penicillium cf. viridicatum]|uniref:Rhodopsin domain-containing protein n=1 Tax=Penicillium cf. viridicatum TaxID=2972119 RepID=A0A9W9MXH0_9EURO|nr:hypothetical protein N7449_003730 [Penicillium cf. viridicatum]